MTKAEEIARKAHEGQKRYDGSPYINHPKAVAKMVSVLGPVYEEVAWLHDVLEDSPTSKEDLLEAGISQVVADAVQYLTKREDEFYEDYLRRVKSNPIANDVKIVDILHNLSDTPTKNQVKKYAKALTYLLGLDTPD